jgi:hypothetical protein
MEGAGIEGLQRMDVQGALYRDEARPHEACPHEIGERGGWVQCRRWPLRGTALSVEAEALLQQPYLRIRLGFGEPFSEGDIDQRTQEGPP